MQSRPVNKSAVVLIVLLISPVIYVVSYAPFLRFVSPRSFIYRSPVAYRPVEYLLVETPMQGPLMWWAEVWGVEDETEFQAYYYTNGLPSF